MASSRERRERRRRRRATAVAEASAAAQPDPPGEGAQFTAFQPVEPPSPPMPVHLQEHQPIRGEVQMAERSIARGWITPDTPDLLKGILRRQAELASKPDVDPRAASRAAKVVVDIVAQVMRDEERQTSREEADRMYALALERARQSQQPDGAAPGQGGATFNGPVHIYPVQIRIPDNGRACQPLESPNSP